MAKGKRRKPDLRRIRTSKTYTLPEIAKTLDRNIATIRSWVRQDLPLLSKQKPLLVLGSDLKRWPAATWKAKARKCQSDELFCFKCRVPRKPKLASVEILPRNEKTVAIKGRCEVCGTRMNQTGSAAKIDEIKNRFGALTLQTQRLTGSGNTSDKHSFSSLAEKAGG